MLTNIINKAIFDKTNALFFLLDFALHKHLYFKDICTERERLANMLIALIVETARLETGHGELFYKICPEIKHKQLRQDHL